jgi:hypothetical protein
VSQKAERGLCSNPAYITAGLLSAEQVSCLRPTTIMALLVAPDALQREASARAKAVFSKLPHDNDLFQQCMGNQVTIDTVLATLRSKAAAHKRKKTTSCLDSFHRYTSWMLNISGPIDVAVNASSGIACPVWASLKFVLMVRYTEERYLASSHG